MEMRIATGRSKKKDETPRVRCALLSSKWPSNLRVLEGFDAERVVSGDKEPASWRGQDLITHEGRSSLAKRTPRFRSLRKKRAERRKVRETDSREQVRLRIHLTRGSHSASFRKGRVRGNGGNSNQKDRRDAAKFLQNREFEKEVL